jgi:hypothetical protein
MATMTIPKKELVEAESMSVGQKRPELERYRMQVDRQTKASIKSKTEAEKAGAAIKKTHPKVQVSNYDADESNTTVL